MCSLKERKRTKKNGEKNAVPNPALNLKKTRVHVSQKRADFEWHEHGHEQVLKVQFLKKIVSVFRYCMLIKLRACPDEFNDLSVFTFDLHLTDLWICIQRTHSSDIVSSKCTICSVYKSHHYVLFDLYNVFWPVLPSPVVERGNRFGWWPQDVPIRRPRELAGEIRSISSG